MALDELALWIGAAIGVATLIIALVLVALKQPREPTAVPPTLDLRAEPPAIVNLLTNNFEMRPEAMQATLLDLTARRWIDMDWYGDQTVLRPRPRGEGDLSKYDEIILDHVKRSAVDGHVTAGALTTGGRRAARKWWERFAHAVIEDARRRDLCVPRRHNVAKWLLRTVSVSLLALVIVVVAIRDEVRTATTSTSPMAFLLFLVSAGVWLAFEIWQSPSLKELDTDAGLRAAGAWLGVRSYLERHEALESRPAAAVIVWDQYMAYAVALGLAPRAVHDLPLRAEDDRVAWSSATGTWRRVRIRYPYLRNGLGLPPLSAIWLGFKRAAPLALPITLVLWAVWPFSVSGFFRAVTKSLWLAVPAFAALAYLAWNLGLIVMGIADLILPARRAHGVVLRRRVFTESPWAAAIWARLGAAADALKSYALDENDRYWIVLERGNARVLVARKVSGEIYDRASEGHRVRISFTPCLKYASDIERLDRPTLRRSHSAIALLADELVRDPLPLPPPMLDRVKTRLHEIRDDEGRPLLDRLP